MWQNSTEVTGPRTDLFSHEWVDDHVQSHGPLGKLYPDAIYKYEGDTPAFFYLLPNGLHEPEHPHYGGWGGRFTREKVRNVVSALGYPEDFIRMWEFYLTYCEGGFIDRSISNVLLVAEKPHRY